MGLPAALIASIDRIGLRRVSASVASLVYGAATVGRQSFSIDADGRWRNHEPEATIASPTVHTTSYAAFRDWVIDNWCWAYRPLPGDTVVDVGAGIGEEAVVFSHLVGPTGHVISIEAHPETFACLKETVRLSKLTNVTPLQIAVGERDGATMIASGKTHLTSSVVRGGAGIKVPLRSLDSLACELGLRDIALLKMNIEGASDSRLRGCGRRVRSPAIYVSPATTFSLSGAKERSFGPKLTCDRSSNGTALRSRTAQIIRTPGSRTISTELGPSRLARKPRHRSAREFPASNAACFRLCSVPHVLQRAKQRVQDRQTS